MCNKMSDVRLSNASPTVERVDARQQDNVRPPVRRSLFGSPDREEIRRYLDAAIQSDVQDFRETYNFDPVEERPLTPRNYEWQADDDAPDFYRRPPHGCQRPRRDADSPGEGSQRDAEGSSEGRSGRQPESGGARKRRSVSPGPCSGECPSKRSNTDEDDDDEDESDGGASQAAVRAAEEEEEEEGEERPSGPGSSAEVR
ncbi:cyclin-dependent kinase inhibitor 1Ba [Acanthopagrus schlegelii]